MSDAQAPTEKLTPSIEVGAPADAQEPAEEWPPSFDVVAPSEAQIATDPVSMGLMQDARRTVDKPEALARKRGRETSAGGATNEPAAANAAGVANAEDAANASAAITENARQIMQMMNQTKDEMRAIRAAREQNGMPSQDEVLPAPSHPPKRPPPRPIPIRRLSGSTPWAQWQSLA